MSRVARSGLLLLFAAVAFLVSCRREAPSNIDRNQAPETYLRRAAAESSLTYYRSHFYWSGADADGQIAYYEVAVTDSNESPGDNIEEGTGYTRTLATDSVFVLAAGHPVEQQIQGKRLYVRAVDNEGKVDPTPARAFFQSRNDYYPVVFFHSGSATWTDKCGNGHTRTLKSTNRDAPTDTVGAGATITWTWGGRDDDPEGYIIGFVYKLESQPQFRGGSLADTTATFTFPPNSGRRQVLEVRAIDDGGLRSSQSFTSSVIVDFDPNTFVVYPPDTLNMTPEPVPGRYFTFESQIYPSGTTLSDTINQQHPITIYFTGLDNPLDAGSICDDTGISRYDKRILYREDSDLNAGGRPWEPTTARLAWPSVNDRSEFNVSTGDWFFLTRAVDKRFNVDSTPETVLVKVNYRPYMISFKAHPQSDPTNVADLLNASGETEIHLAAGEPLVVSLTGADYHRVSPAPSGMGAADSLAYLYDQNRVVMDEQGTVASYRTYVTEIDVFPPGFDNAPDDDSPYVQQLEFPASGLYTIRADVRDRSRSNPAVNGRTGTLTRKVRIQIDN